MTRLLVVRHGRTGYNASRIIQGQLEPGPGHADEVRQVEHLVDVLPGEDLLQRVRPGDEVQLGLIAVLFAQVAKGVDGVGGPAAVDVHPARGEPRVRGGRDHRHQVPVLRRAHLLVGFLPGLAGRHEHDLVQPEASGHFTGRNQVTVVDGIEGTAHDPDPSHRALHPVDHARALVPSLSCGTRPACAGGRPDGRPDFRVPIPRPPTRAAVSVCPAWASAFRK